MSRRKSGRKVDGILLLDKRLGVSSNKALQEIRRLFNANKAGHTGSLDPMATGLLPLCFGEATKVSAMMLDDDKRYQAVIRLGVVTDSGDVEGDIIAESPVPKLSGQQIENCLLEFVGDIEQVPPMYSALKYQGKKLYELAREGITVERKARSIRIYELQLLEFSADSITLDVFCSKGTYIRSLAEDIGNKLGCGASLSGLRRTQAGPFNIADALTLEQCQKMSLEQLTDYLLSVDQPLQNMPKIDLSAQQAASVLHGQQIEYSGHSAEGMVRMYRDQLFLGLGEMLLNGKLAPKKMFNLAA